MFEINTGLIFWTLVSFAILLVLLYKLVFPPLNRILDQRRQSIEGRLEQAKKAQAEAEDLLQKYRAQLMEAEKKTSEMFEDAQHKSQALRDETLKNAQKEAFQIIENTKNDISLFKSKALTDLKGEIADIVVTVSRKLIGQSLKTGDHIKMVESSITELEKHAKGKI